MPEFKIGDIIKQDPNQSSATGVRPVRIVPRLWVVRAVNLNGEQKECYKIACSPLFKIEYWSYVDHVSDYPGCWYMIPECCLLASPVERLLYG